LATIQDDHHQLKQHMLSEDKEVTVYILLIQNVQYGSL